jgi:hypothetical protein
MQAGDPSLLDQADKFFHMVIAIGVIAAGYVGSRIKTALSDIREEQSAAKAELVRHQNEIKEELNSKHAENQAEIRVHTAEDKIQFATIGATNSRMETKLDKLVDRIINGHGSKA